MKRVNIILWACLTFFTASLYANSTDWVVRKTSWSPADEAVYEELITNLGDAVASRKCLTVKKCMEDESINFFASSDPSSLKHYSDCADLPYYLRAYVAWKRDLPFAYASQVSKRDPRDGKDIRYSQDGNRVTARRTLGNARNPHNIVQSLRNILNEVYTATFRTPLIPDANEPLADLYSVDISRQSITPGVSLYDSDGHAYVVYKVEDNGNVKYIDAHPDGTLTLSEINNSFQVSRQEHGWGFKKFRPQTLVGAQQIQDRTGTRYVGGEVVLASDSELADSSVAHLSKKYYAGGERTDGASFYLFARERLAKGNLKYELTEELSNVLSGLCGATLDRAFSTEQAIIQGLDRKSHPARLPHNIYGTSGEWETYSTPSRDARLKAAFVAGFEHVADLIERYESNDPKVIYQGQNLYQDLYNVYVRETANCQFSYKNSRGDKVALDLDDVRRRLWKISFDPYHCIERRWGAEGHELSTCREDSNKAAWYEAEQPLRNQIERRYDDRMDHSLSELQRFTPNSGKGVAEPPHLELIEDLERYGDL